MVVGGYSRLSNSSLKVLQVLASSKSKKGLTQKEIISRTSLSIRSVKSGLKNLTLRNLVLETFLLNDVRCKKYYFEGKKWKMFLREHISLF